MGDESLSIQIRLVIFVGLLAVAGGNSPVYAARVVRGDDPVPDGGARTLYLLPILDGQPSPERALDVVERLGRGGPYLKVGFSGVFRYMAEVDPATDDTIVTRRLEQIVAAARAASVPFLVHLNGGRWSGGGPLVERLMSNPDLMAWDQLDRPWSYRKDGEYFFSLGAYNETWRFYKRRNLQAAAAWLADFLRGPDGSRLIGVSTDSEVLINTHQWSDYNPLVLQEYVHWLSGDAIYGPRGRWDGQGLGLSLRAVNERYGTPFSRWKDVQPPRERRDDAYWSDWVRFRNLLVDHNVQEQVDWIREAGIPQERIFTHQSPALNVEVFGDSLEAAQVDGGNPGITAYAEQAGDAGLFQQVRALGARWGIFEYNPLTDDEARSLSDLEAARAAGASVVCPYHWDDLGGPNEVGFTIRGSAFERALRAFVRHNWHRPLDTVAGGGTSSPSGRGWG